MKNFFKFLIILSSLATINSCKGWSDGIVGVFKVFQPIKIKSEPKNVYFKPGQYPMQLDFHYGIYGLKSPKVSLKVNQKEYLFKIPDMKVNEKKEILASHEQLDQDFSLSAKRVKIPIRSWTKFENSSCSKCDFCYQTISLIDEKGDIKMVNQFNYNCGCSGSQKVENHYTEYSNSYKLLFTAINGNPIGEFTGNGEKFTESKTLRPLEQCH